MSALSPSVQQSMEHHFRGRLAFGGVAQGTIRERELNPGRALDDLGALLRNRYQAAGSGSGATPRSSPPYSQNSPAEVTVVLGGYLSPDPGFDMALCSLALVASGITFAAPAITLFFTPDTT